MALNWSLGVIIELIATPPVIIAFSVVFYRYLQEKNPTYLLLVLTWFSNLVLIVLDAVSQLLLSQLLFLIGNFFVIPIAYFYVLFIDRISSESYDPFKLVLISLTSSALFVTLLDPNSVVLFTDPIKNLDFVGICAILYWTHILLINSLILYYFIKIRLNAPDSVKFYASLNLLGAIIMVPGGLLNIIIGSPIPEGHWLFLGVAALIISISFTKEPRLPYILPFKVYRLAVIEKSGLPLYVHDWATMEDLVEKELFSGMLQAVSAFVDESLRKGDIREIRLANALLIMQPSEQYPIVSVLFTDKSSRTLRHALNSFTNLFVQQFSQYFTPPIHTKAFEPASSLISDCFRFIPEYD
ncbi:MAG: hypothetical protein ACFFC6_10305 [Promethearchaeota archaeon]